MPRRRSTIIAGHADRAPSKSLKKRESEALQALGVSLAKEPAEFLDSLGLPERLRAAIDELRDMSKHGAIRRQRQYIGRLMRETDPAPIREALAARLRDDAERKRRFHMAERWRERIIDEGQPAIDACTRELPVEAARLAELRDHAVRGGAEGRRKAAARELFRYLHGACAAGKL